MALEEFLLDLCEESVTAALLVCCPWPGSPSLSALDSNLSQTFWLFQTYLHDLSSNPQTDAFQTCRRVYNKVQHIVFGLPDAARREKITENVLPVTVLASFVLASIGLPLLPQWAGPMAIAQARKPSPPGEAIAGGSSSDTEQPLPPKKQPTRAQTVTPTSSKSRRVKNAVGALSGGNSGAGPRVAAPALAAVAGPSSQTSLVSPTGALLSLTLDAPLKSPALRQKKKSSSSSRPGSSQAPNSPLSTRSAEHNRRSLPPNSHLHLEPILLEARLSSSSLPLPEMRSPRMASRPTTPVSAGLGPQTNPSSLSRRHSHHHAKPRTVSVGDLTADQKMRLLRQNYFRCETQFLRALEDISNRLVSVPKPARLSALRAELALIGQDLPAEVDIPVICPPSLVNGTPSRSRHHRIVRLNPAEATVLNSAEKVPYLLMVEILREDFTFDPDSSDNQRLLSNLVSEQGYRKRIFDLSDAARGANSRSADATAAASTDAATLEPPVDSVFEPTSGDLGNSPLLKPFEGEGDGVFPAPKRLSSSGALAASALAGAGLQRNHPLHKHPSSSSLSMRHVSGGAGSTSSIAATASTNTTAMTNVSDGTPRSSAASTSRSNSPGPLLRKMTIPIVRGQHAAADQPDFSALATHMRAASQMLAQLEATSGKRPRQEVAAIRAKIIASMQSLEEQSFDTEDSQGPTFDTIIAKTGAGHAASASPHSKSTFSINGAAQAAEPHDMAAAGLTTTSSDDGDDAVVAAAAAAAAVAGSDAGSLTSASSVNPNAGIARMENDFKTGGLQRKGDRDDPSAAVFGEAWDVKRERIRRSSPYGWMKNWDLVSVIVKTGADLRQEAFACQLIAVCDKIWEEAGVSVWVKQMRILVTGESSGLIETITNGVSLHSIKRSLTLASIESGQNPRRRIATLRDYFTKAFGPAESEAHRAGVDAFKRSLAAYSIISYVLQLKDRHNGNVLVDSEGHIVHIDFGFMLSNSPGSVAFEAAPFKLTHEYVEVLGGIGSPDFDDYKRLCKQAFQGISPSSFTSISFLLLHTPPPANPSALRRSADSVVDLVAMMGRESNMPCFVAGVAQTTANLRQRFQLHLSAEDAEQFVETELVAKSLGSYYTRLYVISPLMSCQLQLSFANILQIRYVPVPDPRNLLEARGVVCRVCIAMPGQHLAWRFFCLSLSPSLSLGA